MSTALSGVHLVNMGGGINAQHSQESDKLCVPHLYDCSLVTELFRHFGGATRNTYAIMPRDHINPTESDLLRLLRALRRFGEGAKMIVVHDAQSAAQSGQFLVQQTQSGGEQLSGTIVLMSASQPMTQRDSTARIAFGAACGVIQTACAGIYAVLDGRVSRLDHQG